MLIDNHQLQGARVSFQITPNYGDKFADSLPDAIILHYTAGRSLQSSADYMCTRAAKASSHLLVGRDGAIIQLVPFDTIAWHAGESSYGGRDGYNRYSIGIEMDNAGMLNRSGSVYRAWFGGEYTETEVVEAVHRNGGAPAYWHAYSEPQIAVVSDLCALLIEHYGIKEILGHEEIAPGRKTDPGPAFPLDKLRQQLLAPARSSEGKTVVQGVGIVTAEKLNIRAGPSISASLVADPLPRGTRVEILDERDGWYQVAVNIIGWVSKDYIQR